MGCSLTLGGGDLVGVELAPLELGKEELCHSAIVGVRRRDHRRHLQPLEQLLDQRRLVILCAVQLQYSVCPPPRSILVQLIDQLLQVLVEAVLVGVA